ncbi:hypothetical protein ACP_3507 [Acidobacterium capsulatum ATCC 51196]|uniref:Uncharacterized protein n=1 Tax=Acidobacterium capsulatum (strain ATCC 51196 / DSM 11244 / BCRC 80197 / JCM 7670 / NBRC 15755 / NCIMB 13165 / 161) TaxID=240015 RepID=C1F737_ACIC5|nr:hypothetical protein ACP_3507 [Acidobacterium capsulatum ATCC 51196]
MYDRDGLFLLVNPQWIETLALARSGSDTTRSRHNCC